MKITVTVDVPDTLSSTVANALDKVADEISESGYTDGEWDQTRDSISERRGGSYVRFRIDPVVP